MSPNYSIKRALAQKPYVTHFKIVEAPNSPVRLVGSGTLQVFPGVLDEGKEQLPVILHSHVYPLAEGGQYATFNSRVFWFDLTNYTMLYCADYADNYSQFNVTSAMGTWDWIGGTDHDLSFPIPATTVNFMNADTAYASSWVEVGRRQSQFGPNLGLSTAYNKGPQYRLPNETITQKIELRTGRGQGLAGFTWMTKFAGQEIERIEEQVFWINPAQNTFEQIDTELSVVQVDANEIHTWVKRPTQWIRLN
jgi:hypothetical protein